MENLTLKFNHQIRDTFLKLPDYKNPMCIPRCLKIVVNVGVGIQWQTTKLLEGLKRDVSLITNQQPVFRTAKNSIAAFKLREGMKSSCMVTLRKKKMYNFLHRLISFNLTQIRNFRGLSMKGFNKDGVYSFGVSEQVIFPEIDYSERSFGCGITIVTSARSVAEAKILFEALGIPLRQQ